MKTIMKMKLEIGDIKPNEAIDILRIEERRTLPKFEKKKEDTLHFRQERAWENWRKRSRFGSCYWCGKGWDSVNGHTTKVNSLKGVFICCEGCWMQMTFEERLEAVDFLYNYVWRNMPKEWSIDKVKEAVKREWRKEEREGED